MENGQNLHIFQATDNVYNGDKEMNVENMENCN